MTHEEIVTVFMRGNFHSGDLVKITLTNGDTVFGKLSEAKVYCDEGENGEKINSRIGLLPPPAPPGFIMSYANIPNAIYSNNITQIIKATN